MSQYWYRYAPLFPILDDGGGAIAHVARWGLPLVFAWVLIFECLFCFRLYLFLTRFTSQSCPMFYMLSAIAKLVRMRNGHSQNGPTGQSSPWAVSPILSEEVFRDVLTAPNNVSSN